MNSFSSRFSSALLAASILALASCGSGSGPVEITQTRKLPPSEQTPKLNAPTQERFKFAMPSQPARPQAGPRLAWDTPPGWHEHASGGGMREVSLRFGESDAGECYVMRAGGSIAANVNRWRTQMNLPELSEEEIAALPRRPLFGMDAVLIEMQGDFQGVGETSAAANYGLIGVILPVSTTSLFVKMVGPADLVLENQDAFHAFCDSLRIEQS